MAITKEKKSELVTKYKELVEESRALILTSYSGVTVKELEEVRRKIRELGGEFHIVKNTLFALVMDEAGYKFPEETYVGTTAVGFAMDEVPGVAKAIVDLAREVETVNLKVGLLDQVVHDRAQIEMLADLPPLPVLRSQMLSMIQTPASRVAMSLAGSIRQLLNVTKAYAGTEGADTTAPA